MANPLVKSCGMNVIMHTKPGVTSRFWLKGQNLDNTTLVYVNNNQCTVRPRHNRLVCEFQYPGAFGTGETDVTITVTDGQTTQLLPATVYVDDGN
jgi:hypothetical protein